MTDELQGGPIQVLSPGIEYRHVLPVVTTEATVKLSLTDMNAIFANWLNHNFAGGPWKVDKVDLSNDNYTPACVVKFHPETPKGK